MSRISFIAEEVEAIWLDKNGDEIKKSIDIFNLIPLLDLPAIVLFSHIMTSRKPSTNISRIKLKEEFDGEIEDAVKLLKKISLAVQISEHKYMVNPVLIPTYPSKQEIAYELWAKLNS